MNQVVIENPILNSPFEGPKRHFKFTEDGFTRSHSSDRSKSYESSLSYRGEFMTGKYDLLEKYLRCLPVSQEDVTRTSTLIEQILNMSLPVSARNCERGAISGD